ncbi:MAG: uroporphyrinogen decarboxylase family protein [Candidatus Aminicenantia bacterium]
MNLKIPDRVPLMCQLSLGHYFLNCKIPSIDIWHSTDGFGEALIELQRKYKFDGILINLPGRDPSWRSYIIKIEEKIDKKIIHWKNGFYTVCPLDDNPYVCREDGKQFHAKFEDIEPEKLFYIEPHDISGIKYPYYWGFSKDLPPNFFPPWHFDTVKYVKERVRDISIHAEVFSPFTQFLELLGYTNGLLALKKDPSKVKDCLKALSSGTIFLALTYASLGVDAILISSAFAGGGFISPSHYRDFVLPFEKMVVEGIKSHYQIPVYTHTCGKIGDRLELIAETGTNGIDTLDPPPLGNTELSEAKRRVGKRLFLKGNIDPINVILNGNLETIKRIAKKCIEDASPGGGYILSTACSVPPHAPPENIMILYDVVDEFGWY